MVHMQITVTDDQRICIEVCNFPFSAFCKSQTSEKMIIFLRSIALKKYRILENKQRSARKYTFIVTICIISIKEMGTLQLTCKTGIIALVFFWY